MSESFVRKDVELMGDKTVMLRALLTAAIYWEKGRRLKNEGYIRSNSFVAKF